MIEKLAIIPARGGSKRLPRKNIRPFRGRPVVAYPIEALRGCGCFDEIMVSTDDTEIAEVARSYGAAVPFLRSAPAAGDLATLGAVVDEVLGAYESAGHRVGIVCIALPTAVFLTANLMMRAVAILTEHNVDAVYPVTPFEYPPQRALHIARGGFLKRRTPEFATVRSQDLPPLYHDAAVFYLVQADAFRRHGTFLPPRTLPLVLSPLECQDIDTEDDWHLAELKHDLSVRREEE